MRAYQRNCSCNKGQNECTCGYPEVKPAQQLPTQTMPTQYQPVNQNTEYLGQEVIIPVVHPTHTTQVNHTNYKYMHSFPHTKSVVNSVSQEHYCVCPPTSHRPNCPRNRFW